MRKQAEAKIAAQSDGRTLTKHRVEKLDKNDLAERQAPETATESDGTGRKNKYGNKKCMANGITFDSKKEMYRYLELKGLEDAGLIVDLKLQHHFTLSESFRRPDGELIRKIEYIADFTYFDGEGKFIVEDVKSEATRKNPVYSLKKRLMAREGYKIREV
mgnify:FL=1